MKILLYEQMHQAGIDLLARKAEVVISPAADEETILQHLPDTDAAPGLKVIGRQGVGMDCIDVEAATRRGIWVVNTPVADL